MITMKNSFLLIHVQNCKHSTFCYLAECLHKSTLQKKPCFMLDVIVRRELVIDKNQYFTLRINPILTFQLQNLRIFFPQGIMIVSRNLRKYFPSHESWEYTYFPIRIRPFPSSLQLDFNEDPCFQFRPGRNKKCSIDPKYF